MPSLSRINYRRMVTDGNRRRKMNECRDETDEPAAKKALFKLPREQRNEKRHILRTSFNKVHELFYEKPNIRKALSISNTIRRLRSELLHDIDYIISVDSASVLEPWEDAYRNRENSLKAVVTFKDGVDAVSVICDNITLAEEIWALSNWTMSSQWQTDLEIWAIALTAYQRLLRLQTNAK
ncbi:hypothetical protein CAPTEDRAFT_228893 [Capitella teleta]|uniref:SERTA domain-containing protein n=1 Tax=Capitella teleta TaxID=283909 RepID=R7UQG0_CAPTE|nr:hypothetical protein CAPTEDRAFT_228893 [Capitella teleta]|eukprot:ELU08764.1 hypothetical protein CAPTEDRAFT_228893 [Capitella teleta]